MVGQRKQTGLWLAGIVIQMRHVISRHAIDVRKETADDHLAVALHSDGIHGEIRPTSGIESCIQTPSVIQPPFQFVSLCCGWHCHRQGRH